MTDESPNARDSALGRPGQMTLQRYAELAARIGAIKYRNRLVAVDGSGASGKSTFARRLAGALGRAGYGAVVTPVDDFYRPPGLEGPEPEGLFDLVRLRREVIEPRLMGEPVSYQPFDWETRRVSRRARRLGTPSVMIVEGVFATSPLLGGRHAFGVWVEVPRSLRLSRGLERDGENTRETWTELWMPREDEYRDQTRPDLRADLVVDGARMSPPGMFWRCERAGLLPEKD